MGKVLISWVAAINDFEDGKLPVNSSGPNCTVHKSYWDYDYHLLLTDACEPDAKALHLSSFLSKTFDHKVEIHALAINDVIDVNEISSKVNALLIELDNCDIDIFVSPGTPAMQVAWYFAHEKLALNTHLFHLRKPKDSIDKPQQVWVNIEKSTIPTALLLRTNLKGKQTDTDSLITKSIRPIYMMAEKVAIADKVTVLILGETGTGKEGLARYIHDNSPRAKSPFIAINCSALGETLLESRLFGYVKGSHNTALTDVKGLFEDANGGTIFLDEIGDITSYMQQSLLRVLQEKEVIRIGESKVRKVNVRIISATNRDLKQLCVEGKFRWDLYYRLSVIDISLPPLRERGAKEIGELINFLLSKKSRDFKMPKLKIGPTLKKQLINYHFPGNIRELENLIEKLYALSEAGEVNDNLFPDLNNVPLTHSLKLKDAVYRHVHYVYNLANHNITRAAKLLGINPSTLKTKLNLK